jgi:NAD(P) transhydrogenase subunit beta
MGSVLDNRVVLINVAYLIAAVCFIVGLKLLSSPATARRGNQIAALGMAVAVVATLFMPGLQNVWLILVGLAIGAVLAVFPARSVKMTAMPQMVAIFNGMGGATAALVSLVEFQHKADIGRGEIVSIVLGVIIGSISFSGSMVAFGKLQELISGRAISYPNQQQVNAIIGIAAIALAVIIVALGQASISYALIVALFLIALVLGVLTVLPIGGADMPVVIAVLNSMTGVAAALTGFVLNNQALIIAGILVGASGAFLTLLMARAMNRLAEVVSRARRRTCQCARRRPTTRLYLWPTRTRSSSSRATVWRSPRPNTPCASWRRRCRSEGCRSGTPSTRWLVACRVT